MLRRIGAALVLITTCLVAPQTAAAANATPAAWANELKSVQPQELLTQPDGMVTAMTCSTAEATASAQTFDAIGTETRKITGKFLPCDEQKAVGPDGTLYGVAPQANGAQALAAYKENTRLWEYSFTAPACAASNLGITAILFGGDGNVHTLLREQSASCGEHWYLGGLSPAKTLVYFEEIGSQEVRWIGAYRDGLVAFNASTLRYFSYKGVPHGNAVALGLNSGEWINRNLLSVDFEGRVYAAVQRNAGTSSDCQESTVTTTLAAYSTEGKLGETPQPACTIAVSASAGPWGAVFAGRGGNGEADWYATIGHNGGQLRRTVLDLQDGARNFAVANHAPRVFGDGKGHIVVERTFRSSGSSLYGSEFRLLDAASGNEVDAAASDEFLTDTGHIVQQIGLADGMLYLLGSTCLNASCNDATHFVLTAVSMPQLAMDYPRAKLLQSSGPPEEPRQEKVYFLGDSFMAGPGMAPYEPEPLGNSSCKRSGASWPRVIEKDSRLSISSVHLSCSGATIDHLLEGDKDRQPNQVNELRVEEGVRKVVISIGGNDIEFTKLIYTCILYDCRNRVRHTRQLIEELDEEYGKLISAIREKLGDDVEIYFTGYPYVLPLNKCSSAPAWMGSVTSFVRRIVVGEAALLAATKLLLKDLDLSWHDVRRNFFASGLSFSDAEVIAVGQLQGKFNNQIRESVTKRGAHFVSMTGPDSPFRGHELCPAKGKKSYFFGVNFGFPPKLDVAHFFHPNADGAKAYAQVFAKYYLKNKR